MGYLSGTNGKLCIKSVAYTSLFDWITNFKVCMLRDSCFVDRLLLHLVKSYIKKPEEETIRLRKANAFKLRQVKH